MHIIYNTIKSKRVQKDFALFVPTKVTKIIYVHGTQYNLQKVAATMMDASCLINKRNIKIQFTLPEGGIII